MSLRVPVLAAWSRKYEADLVEVIGGGCVIRRAALGRNQLSGQGFSGGDYKRVGQSLLPLWPPVLPCDVLLA